jgi:hypothetical protein
MNLIRQTEFTLEELFNLLGRTDHSYPHCMLINEVGTICCQEEDPDRSGEDYLLSLLNDGNKNHRAIAASYISCLDGTTGRHAKALAEFRANPENKELLPVIDRQVQKQMSA